MNIDLAKVIPVVIGAWYLIKRWIDAIGKIIEPLIEEAEKLAQDGKLDKADRKKLVMKAVALLQEEKKIKLNFLARILLPIIVDKVAGKLPDYVISQDVAKIALKVKAQERI